MPEGSIYETDRRASTRQAGLGVRVRPSGHRSYVYCRKGEEVARRITLGSAALTGVVEARSKCLAIETGARSDGLEHGAAPTFGEFVAGPGRARLDRCKPSTQKAERWVLRARLLPAFGPVPLDRITHAGVTRWFDEYSRTAPGGANHALSVLRRILNYAVACGYLDTNPARGINRPVASRGTPARSSRASCRARRSVVSIARWTAAVARGRHGRDRRTSSAFCC